MASLDMSLDDMIKSRNNSERNRGQASSRGSRRGRGSGGSSSRGGGRAYGPPRRGPLGLNTRPSAQKIAKTFRRTKNLLWRNGLLEDSLKAAGLSGLVNGTKLYVSNLDFGVTIEDIRDLFSDIGELMRYAVHYDKNGRPSGSAEVIFVRRSDAFQALKRYNNVQLDGKPMKVEIIGDDAEIPVSARLNIFGKANGKRTVVMRNGTKYGRKWAQQRRSLARAVKSGRPSEHSSLAEKLTENLSLGRLKVAAPARLLAWTGEFNRRSLARAVKSGRPSETREKATDFHPRVTRPSGQNLPP